jgi:RNA polymerase sigma factor for flagellar operon FliA
MADINAPLWDRYTSTRSLAARNELVERYLPLLRDHAVSCGRSTRCRVTVNELKSAGALGLIDAIEGFDPAVGVPFEKFAAFHVRGAMIDEMRRSTWHPRTAFERSRLASRGVAELKVRLGRPPTDEELAAHLGASPDEFARIVKDRRLVRVWNAPRPKGAAPDPPVRPLAEDDPAALLERTEAAAALLATGLTRAQRLLMTLYYLEGMTMRAVGQTLDMTESRVCQMHAAILEKVRRAAARERPEGEPATAATRLTTMLQRVRARLDGLRACPPLLQTRRTGPGPKPEATVFAKPTGKRAAKRRAKARPKSAPSERAKSVAEKRSTPAETPTSV